ncbi:hypothetical protein OsJ_14717 [Oryza sativa Japonica Group]|uniref:Uncharacterized protein n=1 Tax=Oryza sativa subsp. japonica TaxID=39947 RepID=B9FF22_ORYSJ|nr:hypothetical protein OsJ_14717 [Oryza sativa Japonica Group]
MLPLPLALVAAAAAAAAFVLASRCLSSRGGKKDDIEAETVDYCARDPINIILHTQGVPALATSSEGAESCDEDAARCWGVGDERRERSSGDTRGGRVGSECEVMREAGLLLPKLRDRSLWGKAARGKSWPKPNGERANERVRRRCEQANERAHRRLAHLLNNQEQRLEQAHGEPELGYGNDLVALVAFKTLPV